MTEFAVTIEENGRRLTFTVRQASAERVRTAFADLRIVAVEKVGR